MSVLWGCCGERWPYHATGCGVFVSVLAAPSPLFLCHATGSSLHFSMSSPGHTLFVPCFPIPLCTICCPSVNWCLYSLHNAKQLCTSFLIYRLAEGHHSRC